MARRGGGSGFVFPAFIGASEHWRAFYDVEGAGTRTRRPVVTAGPRSGAGRVMSREREMLEGFTSSILQFAALIVPSLLMPEKHHLPLINLHISLFIWLFSSLFIHLSISVIVCIFGYLYNDLSFISLHISHFI